MTLLETARQELQAGRYRQAKNQYEELTRSSPHFFADILIDYEKEIRKDYKKTGPRFSLAGFYLAVGEIEEALLELYEILEVEAHCLEAYNVLGKILIKQGRIDEVISLLEKSVKVGALDLALTELLAAAYLEKGRLDEATKFYEEILASRPTDKSILRVLAQLYTRQEKYGQAAASFSAMFSDDPEVSREVMQRLEELLAKVEGSVSIRELLADVYMRSLLPDLAVTKLAEIMRLDSDKVASVIAKLRGILKSYPLHPLAMLTLAEGLRRQNNFSEATECYHDLVKTRPEFIDEAIKGYLEIIELCPEQILARTFLAEGYLYKKEVAAALEQFEAMLKIDPEVAETVILRCREIIKSYPGLPLARLVLGQAYLVKQDLQRAIVEAEGLLNLDKKYTPAYLLLGEAYNQSKLCQKAEQVFKNALALDPYNTQLQEHYFKVRAKQVDQEIEKVKARLAQDEWKMSLHFDLAKLYLEKMDQDNATRELQFVLKDQLRSHQAHSLLGQLARLDGRFEQALTHFQKSLELAPADNNDFICRAKVNVAATYEAQGQLAEAIKIYDEVLSESLDFAGLRAKVKYLKATGLKSLRTRSIILVRSNNLIGLWGREAKMGRGRGGEVNLSFGFDHNLNGFNFFLKGMAKAALEEFQLAVQLDSKFPQSLNNLAACLAKEGRLVEARRYLAEALSLEPNSVVIHNNLGLVCFMLGEIKKAKQFLETALAMDPLLAAACLNLGDVLACLKDVKSAVALYQQIGPGDPLVDLAGQRLKYR